MTRALRVYDWPDVTAAKSQWSPSSLKHVWSSTAWAIPMCDLWMLVQIAEIWNSELQLLELKLHFCI